MPTTDKKAFLKPNSSGFTILELLIATSVFSLMLLLATAGVIQIGRIYHKGITSSRTQETARSVVDDISRSIQLGSNNDISVLNGPGPQGEFARCVGKTRYTYLLNHKLESGSTYSSSPARSPHVLWVDVVTGTSCPALNLNAPVPGDANTDAAASANQRRELLGNNMRLTDFDISPLTGSTSLVGVKIRILYGDDEVIDTRGTPATTDDTCTSSRFGGQFCAVSSLETFVKKRL